MHGSLYQLPVLARRRVAPARPRPARTDGRGVGSLPRPRGLWMPRPCREDARTPPRDAPGADAARRLGPARLTASPSPWATLYPVKASHRSRGGSPLGTLRPRANRAGAASEGYDPWPAARTVARPTAHSDRPALRCLPSRAAAVPPRCRSRRAALALLEAEPPAVPRGGAVGEVSALAPTASRRAVPPGDPQVPRRRPTWVLSDPRARRRAGPRGRPSRGREDYLTHGLPYVDLYEEALGRRGRCPDGGRGARGGDDAAVHRGAATGGAFYGGLCPGRPRAANRRLQEAGVIPLPQRRARERRGRGAPVSRRQGIVSAADAMAAAYSAVVRSRSSSGRPPARPPIPRRGDVGRRIRGRFEPGPILAGLGLPATVFLNSDAVGRPNGSGGPARDRERGRRGPAVSG
jgi:hypothetical protein